MIGRAYEPLDEYLEPNKVLIIYGPRRVGKTTLLQTYLSRTRLKYKSAVGDDVPTQRLLSSRNVNLIKEYLEGYELFALDEAQYIPNIGQALKIIVDQIPGIHVFVTGSSSFELAGQVSEPLTGRKRILKLYPFAQTELLSLHNRFELRQELEERLIFGSYPDVVTARTIKARIEAVSEIANSYLMKDILAFERVRNSGKIWDLLKLLAFQVGSEVSHNELSRSLGVDVKTVQRYIDLLEKSFVLYRLSGFSRNLRKEVTQKAKYFFLDNGIRNAIIAQFNRLDQRDDVGQLWENFMTMERIKYLTYASEVANLYFWRTYSQQEIDLVEERGQQLDGYEFKWSPKKAVKAPLEWINNYPGASFTVVTRENYQKIVFP
ncbi:MAG: ATP-binding protein [Anaerolineales bacterium]|nr:MAG: ATP-binding protein [Anaerolineales bacterium]